MKRLAGSYHLTIPKNKAVNQAAFINQFSIPDPYAGKIVRINFPAVEYSVNTPKMNDFDKPFGYGISMS